MPQWENRETLRSSVVSYSSSSAFVAFEEKLLRAVGFHDIMLHPARQKSHIGDVYPSLGRRMSSLVGHDNGTVRRLEVQVVHRGGARKTDADGAVSKTAMGAETFLVFGMSATGWCCFLHSCGNGCLGLVSS